MDNSDIGESIAKPPLAAWIAGISIDHETFANTLADKRWGRRRRIRS
jgi:hypothetical protein